MPAPKSFLFYYAILIVNVNALFPRALQDGYNKSASISPAVFSGYPSSSSSSKMFPSPLHSQNTSAEPCCFVIQDTIDVRYWRGNETPVTRFSTRTTFVTFATQYIDTLVTTNVSTVVKTFNHTSSSEGPQFSNNHNRAPGPSVTRIPLDSSPTTLFGSTITPPTGVYVFPSVKIINVPGVLDKNGRLQCATTSLYSADCPTQAQIDFNTTTARANNQTQNARSSTVLPIMGVNSNAEAYFTTSPRADSKFISSKFNLFSVSFSTPFIYASLSDPFPSKVANEDFGYVPQALIAWMAQNPDYLSRFPGIASCLPGGPSIAFDTDGFCGRRFYHGQPVNFLDRLPAAPDLTTSSTVTIAGRGCFHPGACPTPPAPGAMAAAATPVVTPEAQSQGIFSPGRPESPSLPQSPNQPLPAPAEAPGSTQTDSPQKQANNAPLNPMPNSPSPPPPDATTIPLSQPTNGPETPSGDDQANNHEALSPPTNPAEPPPNSPAFAAVIASTFGINFDAPSKSEDAKPIPGPTPALSYSISIAPSGSAVVIDGVTSIPPAMGPAGGVVAASTPIFVGSEHVTQNAASQYVVGGQTLTPGASAIDIQGTKVSLAPSASAIVIGASTIGLGPTNAPAFTIGSEIVTADSASRYVVGGQTLTPGGPAVTVSGTHVSLGPSGTQVVVGSSTIGLAPSSVHLPPPLTIGSQTFTANSESNYIVNGQTLAPGGSAIIVSGTPVSLAPGGTQAVIGSSTVPLLPTVPSTLPPLTIGSQTYTTDSKSEYIIAGQTLMPGSPAITVSGTPVSLAPGGTQAVIGSSTIPLLPETTPPPITVGSQTYSPNTAGAYIIGGQTLTPGGPAITVSGTRLSLAPSATQVVIGSSTIPLLPATTPPPLTIGSQTYTANSAFDYIIGSQTLVPGGPAITVSGTRLSLAPSATQVVIGTSTLPLSPSLPLLTIGSQTLTPNAAGLYVIGSQTLTPGAAGVVVPLPTPQPSSTSVYTIANHSYTLTNPTAFSIAGTTITAGGAGVTVDGTRVVLEASGVLDVESGGAGNGSASATSTTGSADHAFTGGGGVLGVDRRSSALCLMLGVFVVVAFMC